MLKTQKILKSIAVVGLISSSLALFSNTVRAVGSGTVVTGSATNVGANSVTLNAVVTPTGRSFTSVFAIGRSSNLSDPVYTYSAPLTQTNTLYIRMSSFDAGSGPIVSQSMSFDLVNWSPDGNIFLQPSTTYYYRAGIQDGPDDPNCIWSYSCYSWSTISSFTTRAAILPTVVTGDATLVGANTAHIEGSAISNDIATTTFVEYGKSPNLSGVVQTASGRANDIMNNCNGADCAVFPASTSSRAIVRELVNLDSESTYYYRVVAQNPYGTVSGEIKTFTTTPPVGITVNSGANYTTSKNVRLSISWPVGATGMMISNDGGFRVATTINSPVLASFDWAIDDSIQGLYTKIVYIRFSGAGIDASRTYQDDIIFDNKPPVVSTSAAELAGSYLVLSVAAKDDESGIAKVEVNNADRTVTTDYAATILLKSADLGLGASSASVRAMGLNQLKLRLTDKAGNNTGWIALGASSVSSVNSGSLSISKTLSGKALASIAKLTIASTSRVSIKVAAGSSKTCKVLGSTVKGLKSGTCKLSISVIPKRGKVVSKVMSLTVSK